MRIRYLLAITGIFILILLFSFPIIKPLSEVSPVHAADVAKKPTVQDFMADSINRFFDEAYKNGHFVGSAIAVIKEDSVIYLNGFGKRSISEPHPVTTETVFRIGSVSKGFGGILAGMLVQDQIIRWDEPVYEHLPEFQLSDSIQTKRIGLQHLLSHTSGLPYHSYTNLVEAGLALDEIASRFDKVPLISQPGELYSYQNAAFALSGEVMSRVTGYPTNELLNYRIFQPLNMNNASCSYEDFLESGNIAKPHIRRKGKWYSRRINSKYYNAVLAGGINASILDMSEYLKLLVGTRPEILSEEALNQVFYPFVAEKYRNKYYQRWSGYESSYYAKGWRVHVYDGDTIVHHGGYVNGYRTEIAIVPGEKIGICAMFNSPTSFSKDIIPKSLSIYRHFEQSDSSLQNNTYSQTD
jgi:beta-lactamase class C